MGQRIWAHFSPFGRSVTRAGSLQLDWSTKGFCEQFFQLSYRTVPITTSFFTDFDRSGHSLWKNYSIGLWVVSSLSQGRSIESGVKFFIQSSLSTTLSQVRVLWPRLSDKAPTIHITATQLYYNTTERSGLCSLDFSMAQALMNNKPCQDFPFESWWNEERQCNPGILVE